MGVGAGSASGFGLGALDGFFSSFPLEEDEDEDEEDLAGGGGEAEVASAAMWFHTRAKLVESAVVNGPYRMYEILCHGAGRRNAHVLTEDKRQ